MPATPNNPVSGLLRDIANSVRGVPRDYTTGSVSKAILLLSIPMVLEMSMQSLFAVVDGYFVGKLGPEALAVVGVTDALLALVFAIGIGISMGTTAMVARRIGEKKLEAARATAAQSILLGVFISIPIGILGYLFAGDLLEFMGMSAAQATRGATFPAIMLAGNASITLLFLINAIFRGAGDPAIAMRALWIANLSNMALDPLLIFGWGPIPAMGLTGAAVATTLGRSLGVAYQFYKLTRPDARISLRLHHLRFDAALIARLTQVSGIGILQYSVTTTSYIGLTRIIAFSGATALAGYTIAVRVILFVLLPAWGVGNAAATLVGQNLGAGNPDRAERSVWLTAAANAALLAIVSVFLIGVGDRIVAWFTTDAQVVAVAASCLRIVSYSYVFWAFGLVSLMAFNGAGDTTTPTWINFVTFWAFKLPLAYALAVTFNYGPDGAFWALSAAQLVLAVLGVIWLRRGTWRHRIV